MRMPEALKYANLTSSNRASQAEITMTDVNVFVDAISQRQVESTQKNKLDLYPEYT